MMKNTKNYEAPVAEMIEMQAISVLMSSDNANPTTTHTGDTPEVDPDTY